VIEKHYKTKDVAELLSVAEATVRRLARVGELKSVKIGNDRRFAESEIAALLKRNTCEVTGRKRLMECQ
jgi:excisionase family DNA binding protein